MVPHQEDLPPTVQAFLDLIEPVVDDPQTLDQWREALLQAHASGDPTWQHRMWEEVLGAQALWENSYTPRSRPWWARWWEELVDFVLYWFARLFWR